MMLYANFMIFRANFVKSCTHPYNFRVFWYPFIEDVMEKEQAGSPVRREEVGSRKYASLFTS